MNCTSPSGERMCWESAVWHESEEFRGVRYQTVKPSLARRAELTRRVRGLVEQLACQAAGESPEERLSAALLELEIDRAYLDWGLQAVQGIDIDGAPATVGSLIERGPERLCREIARRIRQDSSLCEAERKN
jgi:hypothetical protein